MGMENGNGEWEWRRGMEKTRFELRREEHRRVEQSN